VFDFTLFIHSYYFTNNDQCRDYVDDRGYLLQTEKKREECGGVVLRLKTVVCSTRDSANRCALYDLTTLAPLSLFLHLIVKSIKILVMEFTAAFYYFLSARSRHCPQHPVVRNSHVSVCSPSMF
jgi:hypothetical protein